ncbi:hypothetical protein [Streptacidiphilus sp. PAMC 29251]
MLLVLRRGDPDRPWRGALLVTGTALFLAAPGYPWYALLVVALVALDGRWEWLGLPAAAAAVVVVGGGAQQPAYTAALCLVLAGTAVRTLLSLRPPQRPALPAPAAAPSAPALAVPTPIRTGSSR